MKITQTDQTHVTIRFTKREIDFLVRLCRFSEAYGALKKISAQASISKNQFYALFGLSMYPKVRSLVVREEMEGPWKPVEKFASSFQSHLRRWDAIQSPKTTRHRAK